MKVHPSKLHRIGCAYRDSYVNQVLIDSIRLIGQTNPVRVKEVKDGESYQYVDGMCRIVSCLILGIDVEIEIVPFFYYESY